MQSNILWNFLDNPLYLGTFGYKSKEIQCFDLINILPDNAKQSKYLRILCYIRCGNEGPSRCFLTKIFTYNQEGQKYIHWVKAARYPQNSISFCSNEFDFEISNNLKMIYVQSDDIQPVNCHNMELSLVAFSN